MSLLCSGSRRVESSLFAIVRYCMLLCQLYVRSPRPQLLLPRGFHAKAAFVTASTAIDTLHMICMPLPSKRQILGRRSRIPVSCARCLVFIRPLFARVREATSARNGGIDTTSLRLLEQKHLKSGPVCQCVNTATETSSQVCTRRPGPRDSRAFLAIRWLRRRPAPSRTFCRPSTRMWLLRTQVMLSVGLLYTCSHVC